SCPWCRLRRSGRCQPGAKQKLRSSTFSRLEPNTDYSSSERVFVLCKPAGELRGSETAMFGLIIGSRLTGSVRRRLACTQASGPFCRYPRVIALFLVGEPDCRSADHSAALHGLFQLITVDEVLRRRN